MPDLIGVVQHGVVYTGGTKKISEHRGSDPQHCHVPLVVYGPGARRHYRVRTSVETTQIAPTILELLGLDPFALAAVRSEGTCRLPHLG